MCMDELSCVRFCVPTLRTQRLHGYGVVCLARCKQGLNRCWAGAQIFHWKIPALVALVAEGKPQGWRSLAGATSALLPMLCTNGPGHMCFLVRLRWGLENGLD